MTLPCRLVILVLLVPVTFLAAPQPAAVEEMTDTRSDLLRYARATWRSFEALERPGGLPADSLTVTRDGRWSHAAFTSPTDIAAYLWSVLAAEDLRIIGHDEAGQRLGRTLKTLASLDRSHGFFYNWYDAETGVRLATWPNGGHAARPFLSSVDNGWLAAALIMVGNARPDLRHQTDALLAPMDFGFFYDPYNPADPLTHPGQLLLGYWTDDNTYLRIHYGLANTEPRIASYIGIARGNLPTDHYYRLYRTLPTRLGGREPAPPGEVRNYDGVAVFEGHSTYHGARLVPTWGGSMFEALMVPLFVPEERWAPASWGVNHPLYARAQVEFGLHESGYGFWGFSPSASPHGGYREYGVPALGSNPAGYPPGDVAGSSEAPRGPCAPLHGVVTPHASFLALAYVPSEAIANLRALEHRFPSYGPFGFFDSIDVCSGKVSDGVLALDQGMILASIANVLEGDALRRHFCDGPIEAAIRPLIAPEAFTVSWPTAPSSSETSALSPADLTPGVRNRPALALTEGRTRRFARRRSLTQRRWA